MKIVRPTVAANVGIADPGRRTLRRTGQSCYCRARDVVVVCLQACQRTPYVELQLGSATTQEQLALIVYRHERDR